MHTHVLVATACVVMARGGFAQAPRPSVLVLGTGGTISVAASYYGGDQMRAGIGDIVKVPGLDSVAAVESEQFLNVTSVSIGPARWLELSRRVTDIFAARPELRGIVVTHGTDTMEETAYFLDLTVGDARPVVVTGSMRPGYVAGADGPANLTSAVRTAADTNSRGRGTLVVMDDRVFAARDVTKTNSTRVETFQAPERGPLAIVDPEGLFYHSRSAGRTTRQFDIGAVKALPRVDIIYSYPGADSVAIDAVVQAGAKGIIVAGVGRGDTTDEQKSALRRAVGRGVVVVSSTRTGSGRVPIGSRDNLGSGDLNPQKARILLMLALSRTNDTEQIRKIFADNQ